MDLNQLYFDHQILLMKADSALSRDVRNRLEACASDIAARIGRTQLALGASAARAWEALGAVTLASGLQGHAS